MASTATRIWISPIRTIRPSSSLADLTDMQKKAAAPKPVAPAQSHKTVDELAREVLAGEWGDGDDRKNRITTAGYDYAAVQTRVNELLHTQSRPQAVYYTIQRGDMLSAIARKYGTSVSAIQKLNTSLIRNVNVIQAGWKIRVR